MNFKFDKSFVRRVLKKQSVQFEQRLLREQVKVLQRVVTIRGRGEKRKIKGRERREERKKVIPWEDQTISGVL